MHNNPSNFCSSYLLTLQNNPKNFSCLDKATTNTPLEEAYGQSKTTSTFFILNQVNLTKT